MFFRSTSLNSVDKELNIFKADSKPTFIIFQIGFFGLKPNDPDPAVPAVEWRMKETWVNLHMSPSNIQSNREREREREKGYVF